VTPRANCNALKLLGRLGVAIPIADAVSIYPMAELDVGALSVETTAAYFNPSFGQPASSSETQSQVFVGIRLLAPLLVGGWL
jgi:hypothetical protein